MSLGTILLIILILILIGAVRLGRTAPAGAIIPPGGSGSSIALFSFCWDDSSRLLKKSPFASFEG